MVLQKQKKNPVKEANDKAEIWACERAAEFEAQQGLTAAWPPEEKPKERPEARELRVACSQSATLK